MNRPHLDPGRPLVDEDTVVVFDVDDTLYLEATYVRSGFEAVGRYLETSRGIGDAAATLWDDFIAGVRGDAFDRVLLANGFDPEPGLITQLVEVYRSHRPLIGLTPDAEALLRCLGDRPAAAITDGPAASQQAKIEALGLHRFLDPIVVTAELGPGMSKPHHRAFELVEQTFGVASSQCCYLGDNPAKDFIAPLARGWRAIRVRRPSSLHFGAPSPIGVSEVRSLRVVKTASRAVTSAALQKGRHRVHH